MFIRASLLCLLNSGTREIFLRVFNGLGVATRMREFYSYRFLLDRAGEREHAPHDY